MKKYVFIIISFIIPVINYGQCLTTYDKFIPEPDSTILNSEFGRSIDIHQNYAVIGVAGSDSLQHDSGLALVYHFDGNQWIKIATLLPSKTDPFMRFGHNVFISENNIIINAPHLYGTAPTLSRIYIFNKPASGWQDMNETTVIELPEDNYPNYERMSVNSEANTITTFLKDKAYIYTNIENVWSTSPVIIDLSGKVRSIEEISTDGNIIALTAMDDKLDTKINIYKTEDGSWQDIEKINEIKKTSENFYLFGSQTKVWRNYLLANTYSYNTSLYYLFEMNSDWTSIEKEIHLTSIEKGINGDQRRTKHIDMNDKGILINRLDTNKMEAMVSYYEKLSDGWESGNETHVIKLPKPHADNYLLPSVLSDNHILLSLPNYSFGNNNEVYSFQLVNNKAQNIQVIKYDEKNSSIHRFGSNIELTDNVLAIYSNHNARSSSFEAGVVYLYEKDIINDRWYLVHELHPPEMDNSMHFGFKMLFYDNYLMIGAPTYQDSSLVYPLGRVYLYKKNGTSWINPILVATLYPSDESYGNTNTGSGSGFGYTMAMEKNLIVIGAPYMNKKTFYQSQDCGQIYVFEKEDGKEWQSGTETALLEASDTRSHLRLSISLELQNGTIFSGALSNIDKSGKIYVYEQPESGFQNTTESFQIIFNSGTPYSRTGEIIAKGDLLFVGNPREDNNGVFQAGSIVLLRKSVENWQNPKEISRIKLNDPKPYQFLGDRFLIFNNILVAGISYQQGYNYQQIKNGRVSVFQALDHNWRETIELLTLQSDKTYPLDGFGAALACSGDELFVGAYYDDTPSGYESGAVYHIKMPPSLQLMPPVCPTDEAVDLIAYPQGGDWSGPGIQHQHENRFYPSLAGFGEHILTYKTENCYYNGKLKISVGQEQKPIIKDLDNHYLCDNEKVKLEIQSLGADPVQENHSFTWERYSEENQFISTYTSSLSSYEVQYPGKYVIKTDTACNVPSDTIAIQALPNNIEIEPLPIICDPSKPVQLKASPENGIWNSNYVTNRILSPGNLKSGVHYLQYQVSREGACYYSDSLKVIIDPVEKPETELAAENCSKQGTALLLKNNNTSHTLELYDPDASQFVISDSTLLNEFHLTQPGQYRLTGYKHTCSSTAIPFDFFPEFALEMPVEPNLLFCQNNPPILQAEEDEQVKYYWQHFLQDGWQVANQDFSASVYSVTAPGIYRLEATRNHCHFTSETFEVELAATDTMFIPNVVTPNNDGLNDRFEFFMNNDLPRHLVVMNRWGKILYENKNYLGNWPDQAVNSGVYYYQLYFQTLCNSSPEPIRGWVQIINELD